MTFSYIYIKQSLKLTNPLIKIIVLYFFLAAGGVWHILGNLQWVMDTLAAPLLIGLGLWLFGENFRIISLNNANRSGPFKTVTLPFRFTMWGILVISGSILIETVGVKTGSIFGNYTYGNNLSPYIGPVPVAIGFAWLAMLLSSIGLTKSFFPKTNKNIQTALLSALFMTVFDIIMEPAAVKLGYWRWENGIIPIRNYFAWFIISFFFVYLALFFRLFKDKLPKITCHAYIAQSIYFILIYFS